MATIQNDRDVLLQAAAVRVVPVTIAITDVVGLPAALAAAEKGLEITASAAYFSGATGAATSPAAITLTAVRKNDLAGAVSWAVEAGVATLVPSGDTNNTCSITGSTVSGASVTVRARVSDNGRNYDARITIGKYGALTMQNAVDLTTQVTGQLNSGKVTGLGALALLNTVDLNTQTVGALNGATQVTNLGTLAYANAIAANQIGAGTLAVGVAYAGTVNATQINAGSFSGKEFTGGTFTGGMIRTAVSGARVEVSAGSVFGYRSTGASGFILTNAGNLTLYGESLVDLPPLAINPTGADGHIYLTPKAQATFPAKKDGLIFWHDTWKLCISNGVNWYTLDTTILPDV